ncbi:MAG: Hint domain-containing protein [Pseudomonadota bacterium]
MAWICLTTQDRGAFDPSGLPEGKEHQELPLCQAAEGLLARGTVYLDVEYPSVTGRELTLFAAATQVPWGMEMRITALPSGNVSLTCAGPNRRTETMLIAPTIQPGAALRLTYTWDGPAQIGHFSAHWPNEDELVTQAVVQPMPLPMALIRHIAQPDVLGSMATFVAVADHQMPIGPMPGVGAETMVETSMGHKPISDLSIGDSLMGIDGTASPVLSLVRQSLPCFGSTNAMVLRPRSMEDAETVVVTAETRVMTGGPDVEYLIGEQAVLVAARQLERARVSDMAQAPAFMTFYQAVCAEPIVTEMAGTAISTLYFSPSAKAHNLRTLTTIADIPGNLFGHGRPAAPVLKTFEAVTLAAQSQAA